ncbi:MAG TPA: DUF2795 domain-containing protein [Pseudonocardia sp.]|nr:DUF2795 domain-containing protein [Pseudonocardia sp.]
MVLRQDDRRAALALMLSDVQFPAPLWMLLAHAHWWGAPTDYVDHLGRLPDATYERLADVLTACDRLSTDDGA